MYLYLYSGFLFLYLFSVEVSCGWLPLSLEMIAATLPTSDPTAPPNLTLSQRPLFRFRIFNSTIPPPTPNLFLSPDLLLPLLLKLFLICSAQSTESTPSEQVRKNVAQKEYKLPTTAASFSSCLHPSSSYPPPGSNPFQLSSNSTCHQPTLQDDFQKSDGHSCLKC